MYVMSPVHAWLGGEVAVQQVGRDRQAVTAVGRRDAEAPLAAGADPVLPHQSLHALLAHADALSVKFPPDARPAIGSARFAA